MREETHTDRSHRAGDVLFYLLHCLFVVLKLFKTIFRQRGVAPCHPAPSFDDDVLKTSFKCQTLINCFFSYLLFFLIVLFFHLANLFWKEDVLAEVREARTVLHDDVRR